MPAWPLFLPRGTVDHPMSSRRAHPAETTSTRTFPWWLIGVLAVMFVFALFGNRGILHLFELKRQQAGLQQQLAGIEEVNNGLRTEITSLNADRRHLERMARSQLGMVREDEVVYQFATKERPSVPAASAVVAAPSR